MANLKELEIGVLWEQTSRKGNKYLTGNIKGEKVIAFENKEPGTGPKIKIYKSVPRETDEPKNENIPF